MANKDFSIDREYLKHIRFAGDIVLVANNPVEMQLCRYTIYVPGQLILQKFKGKNVD